MHMKVSIQHESVTYGHPVFRQMTIEQVIFEQYNSVVVTMRVISEALFVCKLYHHDHPPLPKAYKMIFDTTLST